MTRVHRSAVETGPAGEPSVDPESTDETPVVQEPEAEAEAEAPIEEEAEAASDDPTTDQEEGEETETAPPPPPAPTLVDILRADLAAKEGQLHKYIGAYKQAKEEMAKARERLERDRDKQLRRDRMALATKLLDVLDNLDRSVQGVPTEGPAARLADGVRLVQKQFVDVLGDFGVTRTGALGSSFDPKLHEAVGAIPAHGDQRDQEVVFEQRAGYLFEGQLLRAAQVIVAQG